MLPRLHHAYRALLVGSAGLFILSAAVAAEQTQGGAFKNGLNGGGNKAGGGAVQKAGQAKKAGVGKKNERAGNQPMPDQAGMPGLLPMIHEMVDLIGQAMNEDAPRRDVNHLSQALHQLLLALKGHGHHGHHRHHGHGGGAFAKGMGHANRLAGRNVDQQGEFQDPGAARNAGGVRNLGPAAQGAAKNAGNARGANQNNLAGQKRGPFAQGAQKAGTIDRSVVKDDGDFLAANRKPKNTSVNAGGRKSNGPGASVGSNANAKPPCHAKNGSPNVGTAKNKGRGGNVAAAKNGGSNQRGTANVGSARNAGATSNRPSSDRCLCSVKDAARGKSGKQLSKNIGGSVGKNGAGAKTPGAQAGQSTGKSQGPGAQVGNNARAKHACNAKTGTSNVAAAKNSGRDNKSTAAWHGQAKNSGHSKNGPTQVGSTRNAGAGQNKSAGHPCSVKNAGNTKVGAQQGKKNLASGKAPGASVGTKSLAKGPTQQPKNAGNQAKGPTNRSATTGIAKNGSVSKTSPTSFGNAKNSGPSAKNSQTKQGAIRTVAAPKTAPSSIKNSGVQAGFKSANGNIRTVSKAPTQVRPANTQSFNRGPQAGAFNRGVAQAKSTGRRK